MIHPDPLWYKDAIIYEVHVRAFHDSVGDGYGDFRGLTKKLDYLQDLGVTAIWVLPFYPSPLRDDGYDIADYSSVHPQYGKIEDLKEFLDEAHRRGLRVITELVINHTSDQHPWFQRARLAPKGSPERDFYVWSDSAEKYADARIIFKDFETSNWSWDPVAKQYYWHRFYSHQPDLNYDNPAVWDAILPLVDYWMDMGVDGMRLDAVPYLYEREGTNCENLPETHAFLKALRRRVDERFPGRMFLAEANQWPEDAVAYFGDDDECHMCFHFPLMPRLFMALHQEDRFPIIDILSQTPPIPESSQWCMFLRNHDELTLEMVTDEERDYMYRAYAQDRHARINLGIRHRLAPLLKNDRRRIELMNALLFSMPGTPVVYYGDEIGMGDNIYLGDRNGVRTPMQWSNDRNAGFSRANPQRLFLPIIIDPEYHYEAVNVEAQQNNPSSLLWWMKRLIALRKRFKAFGRGTIEFLKPDNPKILAFIRRYRDERILVVANLSRFVQYASLDLREFIGVMPDELFGRSIFPPIGELPYLVTLGPHSFYWFSLADPAPAVLDRGGSREDFQLALVLSHLPLTDPAGWEPFTPHFSNYFRRRQMPWWREAISTIQIIDVFPITVADHAVWFLILRVEFRAGVPETVSLPLTAVDDQEINQLLSPLESSGFVRCEGTVNGILCHATEIPACNRAVLHAILNGRTIRRGSHELAAVPIADVASSSTDMERIDLSMTVQHSERKNTSIAFNESYVLKTFLRVEDGVNPDLEIAQALAKHSGYRGVAEVLGHVEYRRREGEPATLAVLHRFIPNQGTAWQQALDHLSSYFEAMAAISREHPPLPPESKTLVDSPNESTGLFDGQEAMNGFLESTRTIAQRTVELHLALASIPSPVFTPEPFGKLYQRSIYQSMRNLTGRLCERLSRDKDRIPADVRPLAERMVSLHDEMLARFSRVLDPHIGGSRIRCHGDFHLGQLLFTGKDYVIIDLEGEATRTIGERRIKRSPLRDVASMIRSFDYAVQSVLYGLASSRGRSPGMIRSEDRNAISPWATTWYNHMTYAFATEYFRGMEGGHLLPSELDNRRTLLDVFILEKALLEADFEWRHRPEWLAIPLRASLRLMGCNLTESGFCS